MADSKEKKENELCDDVTGDDRYEHYAEGEAFYIGCAQCVLAEVSVLTWACAVYFEAETDKRGAYFYSYSLVCAGVWGGLYMLAPGGFGVVSAQKKSRETITAFLVLSAVAIFPVGLFYLTWSVLGLVMASLPVAPREAHHVHWGEGPTATHSPPYGCVLGTYNLTTGNCARHRGLLAAYGACAVLAVVHLALAIRSIVLCSLALCWAKPEIPENEIPLTDSGVKKVKH